MEAERNVCCARRGLSRAVAYIAMPQCKLRSVPLLRVLIVYIYRLHLILKANGACVLCLPPGMRLDAL